MPNTKTILDITEKERLASERIIDKPNYSPLCKGLGAVEKPPVHILFVLNINPVHDRLRLEWGS